jgi:hypothetical protein
MSVEGLEGALECAGSLYPARGDTESSTVGC